VEATREKIETMVRDNAQVALTKRNARELIADFNGRICE
jgi:hypothetical protein